MEALKKAVEIMGSQTALANAIKASPQTVNNWFRRGKVPAEYCPAIEKATHGKVRCEELQPRVDWSFIRASQDLEPPGINAASVKNFIEVSNHG